MSDVKVTHIGKPDPKLCEPMLLHLMEWLQERGELPVEEDVAEIVAQYEEEPVEDVLEVVS
jgi:hypothetical protein